MRGKVSGSTQQQRRRRITPAYAGKRKRSKLDRLPAQDHPRLCGEKPFLEALTLVQPGITPAYAGKSRDSGVVVAIIRDHPRLCGEKSGSEIISYTDPGSPPPMRGKGSKSSVDAGKYWITPAYAGKSSFF